MQVPTDTNEFAVDASVLRIRNRCGLEIEAVPHTAGTFLITWDTSTNLDHSGMPTDQLLSASYQGQITIAAL